MNWQKAVIAKVDTFPARAIYFVLEMEDGTKHACTYTKPARCEHDLLRMVCRVPEYYMQRFKQLEGMSVEVVLAECEDADCFPRRWTEVARIRKLAQEEGE